MTGEVILAKTLSELENNEIVTAIELRFKDIIDRLEIPENSKITHKKFNEILSEFVNQLHPNGLGEEELFREAFSLTNKHYSQIGDGYSEALLDVVYQGANIKSILQSIADNLISDQLSKYIEWIIQKNIAPNDWELKRLIVEELFNNYSHLFTEEIKSIPKNQLLLRTEILLKQFISSQYPLTKLLNR